VRRNPLAILAQKQKLGNISVRSVRGQFESNSTRNLTNKKKWQMAYVSQKLMKGFAGER
jgi:hypothetical protein